MSKWVMCLIFSVLILPAVIQAQRMNDWNIPTSGHMSWKACNGNIFDDGGYFNNYKDNSNGVFTIYPGSTIHYVSLKLTTLDLEQGQDFLYVYDGENTSAPLLQTFTGTITSPASVVISDWTLIPVYLP